MSKNACILGFVLLGIGTAVNLAFNLAARAGNSADVDAAMTNFVPVQNNMYPNGTFSRIGVTMGPTRPNVGTQTKSGASLKTLSGANWGSVRTNG